MPRHPRLDPLADRYAARTHGMKSSEIRALFAVASRPEVVSLAGGSPYIAALPLDAVGEMLVRLETALAPLEARPHWGKLFDADAAAVAPHYERMPDFVGLIERLDPRGAFRNLWLRTRVLGER